jgi:hypothetical protein
LSSNASSARSKLRIGASSFMAKTPSGNHRYQIVTCPDR